MQNKTKSEPTLTRQQLAIRWACCYLTVVRDEKRYGLEPCDVKGVELYFRLSDVEAMEERRRSARLKRTQRACRSPKILSTQQIKRAVRSKAVAA
jgi:hypothetical protein